MSDDDPIPLEGIPVFTGDLALLDVQVSALTQSGAAIATAAGDVHSTFGGLQAFYEAPEADQLFATTQPVADRGVSLKSDLATITSALNTYAQDAEPLIEKLKQLKRDAGAFRVKIAADDEWREDGDLVGENNRRREEIAETWAAFQAVERACYNKIVALVGGAPLRADDGSGKAHTYGYDAEALKHAEGLPWGDPVEESVPWWYVHEHAWNFAKGFFVDGVGGTLKGLGTLFGKDGLDAAEESWKGLGKVVTGLALAGPATAPVFLTVPEDKLPGWLRDSRAALPKAAEGLLAWDQWSEDPCRAAGTVSFNILASLAGGGTGSAVTTAGKGALAAKALSYAGKAGRAVDPMTYVFKGAGAGLRTAGDLLKGFRGERVHVPAEAAVTLPEGAFKLPDGTLHLPEGAAVPEGAFEVPSRAVRLPDGAEIPPGATDLGDGVVRLPEGVQPPAGSLRIPEGALKLPEGTTALPENVLRGTDEAGNTVYLDGHGNLLREDGTLLQHHSAARQEGAGVRASASPEEALAGAGRSSDTATHHAGGGGHLPSRPLDGGGSGRRPPDTTSSRGGGRADDGRVRQSAEDQLVQRTPEEAKRIQDEHVRLANDDPAWRAEHYTPHLHRRTALEIVDGQYLPVLKDVGNGKVVAASDLPYGPSEKYRLRPESPTLSNLSVDHRAQLDSLAGKHLAYMDLGAAERAHTSNPSTETAEALRAAKDSFGDTPVNTKIGEELGEAAARLHVIREVFPHAREVTDLPRTANGSRCFDQLYELDDGGFLIVEAKAPNGRLDWRQGAGINANIQVKQGTIQYLETIVTEMHVRGGRDRVLAEQIRIALLDEKVQYVMVRAKHHSGSYAGGELQHFKIFEGEAQ